VLIINNVLFVCFQVIRSSNNMVISFHLELQLLPLKDRLDTAVETVTRYRSIYVTAASATGLLVRYTPPLWVAAAAASSAWAAVHVTANHWTRLRRQPRVPFTPTPAPTWNALEVCTLNETVDTSAT
jgi:hypothetical protein